MNLWGYKNFINQTAVKPAHNLFAKFIFCGNYLTVKSEIFLFFGTTREIAEISRDLSQKGRGLALEGSRVYQRGKKFFQISN